MLNMTAGQQVLRRLDSAFREYFQGKRGPLDSRNPPASIASITSPVMAPVLRGASCMCRTPDLSPFAGIENCLMAS
jgi:hypothetical protein